MRVQDKTQESTEAEMFLETLVNISSPTSDRAAVNRIQKILAKRLKQLGFKTTFLSNPDKKMNSGDLLTARLEGSSGKKATRQITLVSHADTVLPLATTGKYRRASDGQTASGSGVIDNKGGLVVALFGIQLYLAKLNKKGLSAPPFHILFVCSPNEEAGSLGFHEEFVKSANKSQLILGFEPALENGSIVESRRGNRWYQVRVQGQEAHAGRCQGEQINAAHDLAIKIAKLSRLHRPAHGVSLNVAQIKGGRDSFNVVCGEASAKIDTRFASFESRDALHEKMEKILLNPEVVSPISGKKSLTTYTIEDDCPPFSTTPESKILLKLYLTIVSKIEGRKVISEKAGGASDVNYMSRKGVIVFDGLGPIGGKMHTDSEFIKLESLTTRAMAFAEFLEKCEDHL